MPVRRLHLVLAAAVAASGAFVAGVPAAEATMIRTCGNAAIASSASEPDGAMGHSAMVLTFQNTGTRTCKLTGYPGFDAIDGSLHVMAHARRSLNGHMGGAHSKATIRLAPGESASATVEWSNFDTTTSGACPTSTFIAFTPPHTTATVGAVAAVTVCELQVHPVVAGTSGQA